MNETERQFFLKLQESRKHDAETFNKPENSGFISTVVEKYSKPAHFIYELIQNADDALATEAFFSLSPNGLYFKHNGSERFTVSNPDTIVEDKEKGKLGHLNAITYTGFSTKDKNGRTNKIGKFGIGFKAVFQYTTMPYIYDDNINFRLVDYFVPEEIESEPSRKKGETVFYLPFDRKDLSSEDAYGDIFEALRNLDNPVLFLNNLEKISWETDDGINSGKYSKKVKDEYSYKDINGQFVLLENSVNSTKERLWLFTRTIKINNTHHPISVGFYLKKNKIDYSRKPKVYCFFSTEKQLDLCFLVHAPFVLTDNREGIRELPENTELYNKLALLAAESLVCLRNIGMQEDHSVLVDENLVHLILTKENQLWNRNAKHPNPLSFFFDAFAEIICKEPLLLSREKKYLLPKNACICNQKELKQLLNKEQLNLLIDCQCDIVFNGASVEDVDYFKKLGVTILTPEDFARYISKDFLKVQTIEWMISFYKYLYDSAKKLWRRNESQYGWQVPLLENKSFIMLQGGGFAAKSDDVYLRNPSNRNVKTVKQVLLKDKDVENFFLAFGLKEKPSMDVEIKEILPDYEIGKKSISRKDELQYDILTIILGLSEEKDISKKTELITAIRKSWKAVGCNCLGRKMLRKIDELYDDKKGLRPFFGYNPDIYYFDEEFYEIDQAITDDFFSFKQKLQLSEIPKIYEKDDKYSYSFKYMQKSDFQFFSNTIPNGIGKCKNLFCNGYEKLLNQYDYLQYVSVNYTDFIVDGLKHSIEHVESVDDSIVVWNVLCKALENYDLLEKSTVTLSMRYKPPRAHGYSTYDLDAPKSSWVDFLIDSKWLYDKEGKLCKPSEVFIDKLDRKYDYNQKLFDILEIKRSHRFIDEELIKNECSSETLDELMLGRKFKEFGGNEENMKEFFDWKRMNDSKKERQNRRTDTKEQTGIPFSKQKEYTPEDMFAEVPNAKAGKVTPRSFRDKADKIQQLEKEQQERKDEITRIEELIEIVKETEQYSYAWFKTLLELEYMKSGEASYDKKGIRISFGKVESDSESNRILILKSPSRYIPQALEECSNIAVTFLFSDANKKTLTFEVANVKDFVLRLKCKNESESDIEDILSRNKNIVRADIDTGTPIQLIDKLRKAFDDFGFEDSYSLKDNLSDNVEFVFGPPGTGKTTYLANEIHKLISQEYLNPTTRKSRILVLCPTNKACDVLFSKLISLSPANMNMGFYRFKATGDETLEDYICDSTLPVERMDKLCVVSTMARFPYDGFDDASLDEIDWDYVIVDEASMIGLAYIVYTIYKCPNSKIVIAGDPFQIDPIVHEELWSGENIYSMVNLNSFKSPKTSPRKFPITNLTTQYRSVPAIGELFSTYAYDSMLQHNRKSTSQRKLNIDGVEITSVNFMTFPVEKYDSLFSPHRLSSSNVHLYSVQVVFEFLMYLSAQIEKNHPNELFKIGVICPYRAQAEIINKLWEQRIKMFANVNVAIGTVHGFQGDECDIIFAVYNPPASGMKKYADKTFMNRKNILNVAISRAKDYLFLFMPNKDYEFFDEQVELKRLGNLAVKNCFVDKISHTSEKLECIMFGQSRYIEENTFVTTHQLANVYTNPTSKYEIRIDEESIDIQVDF